MSSCCGACGGGEPEPTKVKEQEQPKANDKTEEKKEVKK